jgi:hypothetical protein
MREYFPMNTLVKLTSAAACAVQLCGGLALAQTAPTVFVDQGPNWTAALRAEFYSRDQGAKMIPLEWLRSLKQRDGQPFLADGLGRYGYLPNPDGTSGLPVGFTASGPTGAQMVGMTCSACHTRQITAEGKAYRIDGGPAIVDFQSLLSDIDAAVGNVLASDAAFLPFAVAVLASSAPDSEDVQALKRDVEAWYLRYHTLMVGALPKAPAAAWGPARLDAVGMIFNRLTGLDLGSPPSFLIPENIRTADAPVRYPFLWNAPRQDKTQWAGFADNGSDILALGRNLGQVLGVFGIFQPRKEGLVINFLNNNSANFDGLSRIELLIKQIGRPKWPWGLRDELVAEGEAIYNRDTDQGGCVKCHSIKSGKIRFPLQQTWDTPVQDVTTDTRQYDVLDWTAKTGALRGAYIPFLTSPLGESDKTLNILKTSVLGSIVEHVLNSGGLTPFGEPAAAAVAANMAATANQPAFAPAHLTGRLPPALRDLAGAFNPPGSAPVSGGVQGEGLATPSAAAATPARGIYEARVMQGIWAAAPYLHNGSVPTLAELLKPAAERVQRFKIGPAYDKDNVGLAAVQTQFDYELVTTDCSARNSGNSRCGHEFGTRLSEGEKKALLEYLKSL